MNQFLLPGFILAIALTARGATASDSDVPSRLWVRLEDERGSPATARVYLRSEQGEFHVPEASIGRGRKERFFHARGQFQTVLPPGKYTIEVVKGFEYEPVTKELNLSFIELGDRTTAETVTLRRFIDMPALGWFPAMFTCTRTIARPGCT